MLTKRKKPCDRCPFRRSMSSAEVRDAQEPGDSPCVMLCHESGCLDGSGPDMECAGFSDNLERTSRAGSR